MKNPIPSSNLFKTMTLEDIQQFIEQLPKNERANASLVFMFTLNACHAAVEAAAEEMV